MNNKMAKIMKMPVLRTILLAMCINAAVAGTTYGNTTYLAHFHSKMGGCETCHASAKGPSDDKLIYENTHCVECHGDLKEIAINEPKAIASPHASHLLADPACTSCHKGHGK